MVSSPLGLSTHSSFSLFLISGLAALISIFKFDVGVQGSQSPASLPLVGVVREPMFPWYSVDIFLGVFVSA